MSQEILDRIQYAMHAILMPQNRFLRTLLRARFHFRAAPQFEAWRWRTGEVTASRLASILATVFARVAAMALLVPTPSYAQTVRWVVGGTEGKHVELAANPNAVRLGDRTVIVNGEAPYFLLVSANGEVLDRLGLSGGGPQEFRRPLVIPVGGSADALLVYDAPNARLTHIAVGDRLHVVAERTMQAEAVRGLCSAPGTLTALVQSSEFVLVELNESVAPVRPRRRFGVPFTRSELAEYPQVLSLAGSGHLACSPAGDLLAVVSGMLGEVALFNREGQQIGFLPIPKFVSGRIAVRDGGLSLSFPPAGYDLPIDLFSTGQSTFQLVVAHYRRDSSGHVERRLFSLFEIETPSLRILNHRESRWRPVKGHGKTTVCIQDEPIPTIVAVEGAECPDAQ